MANCIITSDEKTIEFVFNDESEKIPADRIILKNSNLKNTSLMIDGSTKIEIFNGKLVYFSKSGTLNSVAVDSINGEVPADNADLANKFANLITRWK